MSKKNKKQVIEIPEMYRGLPTEPRIQKMLTEQCIVKDKHGKFFRFLTPSANHIVSGGIETVWANFNQFHDDAGPKVVLPLHELLFKSPVPEGQSYTINAMNTWFKICQEAEDRTGSTTPKDPVTGRKSTIGTRKYFRVMVLDDKENLHPKACSIKTPQAVTCLAIFDDAATPDKDGIPTVTEEDLKKKVYERGTELKTRQDAWRIFQYYRPQLLKDGVIKHD